MRKDAEKGVVSSTLDAGDIYDAQGSASAIDSSSALSDVEGGCVSGPTDLAVKQVTQDGSTTTSSLDVSDTLNYPCRTHDLHIIPIPVNLRYDSSRPPQLSLTLNVIFAATCTVFVANLYYCQPILIQLSEAFGVSYSKVSNIPTLVQAGYTAGLFLIVPLGDLVFRRPLILLLTSVTLALTIGTAFTFNFVVFEVLSVLTGVVTCVSQILSPITADLVAPSRRASALSILIAGVLLGILYARIIAGVIAQFTSWRVVYYVAAGLQAVNILVLYWVVPDYPVKNKGLTYLGVLRSLMKYAVTEPVLIQASLVCMVSMACFTNFWVTLTFLLADSPYNYSTIVIGLFGLVGVLGICVAPFVGRTIDRLLPWAAAVVATLGLIVFQAIQTGAGGVNIAAVVIVCFGIDVFRQFQQVSLNTIVFDIEPAARARMNAILQISVFIGQMMGTAVGTKVFLRYGWRPAAALSVAWSGFTLVILLIRGPHCNRFTWFGYEGGRGLQKTDNIVPRVVIETAPEKAPEISFKRPASGEEGVIHLQVLRPTDNLG